MKFGKRLERNAKPEWRTQYLDYKALKELIKTSVEESQATGVLSYSPRTTSLTVVRANKTASASDKFFSLLESEVAKVGKFTQRKVDELRSTLKQLQAKAEKATDAQTKEQLLQEAKAVGDNFLALEKYVNLNYLGFHKIIKKHDKNLPDQPCRPFYVSHLHQQPWVQGTYSDLLVSLSNIYSMLRGDTSGERNEDAAQGFVRSTTKYWVHTEDVSIVKHHVLQHLPVFQYSKDDFAGDAQLINSVYLDNSNLELYHGRLDKRPNAIAVRLRWYGPNEPKVVFVERKTHRESWKGEESVKERVMLSEEKVLPFLEGDYTVDVAAEELRAKGKTDREVERFTELFSEVQAVVDSKQLAPMVRTQYMRTAFQIPFDATVRISLDTNLTMIKENPEEGPTCYDSGRWYRDPSAPIHRTEITRFPHAVLEVKLSLPEGQSAPAWVTELLDSGYLSEVHKFSKFIHGCATLLPELVQGVPYWIDDESLRESIVIAGAGTSAAAAASSSAAQTNGAGGDIESGVTQKPRKRKPALGQGGADLDELRHPLLGDAPTLQLMPNRDEIQGFRDPRNGGPSAPSFLERLVARIAPARPSTARQMRTNAMRIEPKTFFANERTFLAWLHMAVTIGSIAAALLGFAATTEDPSEAAKARSVTVISLILLPLAVCMCAYALFTFLWRSSLISRKRVGHFDDRVGPMGLATAVVLALSAILVLGLVELAHDIKHMVP